MKAVVYDRSEKLKLLDVPVPEPEPDQVLVRVSNTGFCGSDHSLIESGGLADGYILGHEVSGEIADMGAKVTGCRIGSRVIIRPSFCGLCRECMMNLKNPLLVNGLRSFQPTPGFHRIQG